MRPGLLVLLALLATVAPARAWWGRKRSKPYYVDLGDERKPKVPQGWTDPQAELADIMKKVEDGRLPKIEFDFDSAHIKLASRPTLDAVADLMLRNPKLKLMIRAHTDAVGTEAYNLDLSARRAKAVMTYLARLGVPPPFMRYRGLGFSEPIADNSTPEGRAKNRRVEFRVTFRRWDAIY